MSTALTPEQLMARVEEFLAAHDPSHLQTDDERLEWLRARFEISIPEAPEYEPGYSQAVRVGNTVYVGGTSEGRLTLRPSGSVSSGAGRCPGCR